MGKKRESSIEDLYADESPASKRARTNSSDDEAAVAETVVAKRVSKRVKGKGKGKGKARQVDNDEEDEAVDDEEKELDELEEDVDKKPVVEDDERFEEEHEEAIRAAIEAKRKVHGGIAEHGIIESIEMCQFMCHKYLTFTFGSQINFIIGHNGSGKSAVLSAITVALGGKANSTGRGTGLKSFIREGQGVAEVTISIKNQGEEAYKPKEYGKSIVITRKFTKEGSSSWKIKSKDGRVISTKKDELSAICDHMNIQVDNPMNVLTQDSARQFLSASNPADKYKFFLRGTQLSQLSDEYETCLENIRQTTKVLQQKREAIPDLRTAFKEASMRYKEASKAREQKKKADDLKKELAWAHVAAKEKEMTLKIEDTAKMSRRLPRIEASIATADANFTTISENVARLESELGNLGDIEHLNERKKTITELMKTNRTKISAFKAEERQMDISLKAVNNQIVVYTEKIAEETRRMAADTQAKRDETNRKLDQARADVAQAETRLKNILDQQRGKGAEIDEYKKKVTEAENAKSAAQRRIQEIDDMIKQCKQQQQNAFIPYGLNIKEVLDQIGRMKWHGEKPLGPLGRWVQVKDPHSWADLLRSQLGQLLTAFALTDSRDRPQLKRLLDQYKNHNVMIIIYEKDMFDYRGGEPEDREKLTVLRALEITDESVLRILINQAHIERTFIAKTRIESENVLQTVRSGVAFTADGFRVNKFGDGGGSSTRLQFLSRNDPRNLLFRGKDTAGDMRHFNELHDTAETEYRTADQNVKHFGKLYGESCRALDALKLQERKALDDQRKAKFTRDALQLEANEELPAGIAGFEAAIVDGENEKTSILAQFAEVTRQRIIVDEEQKPLLIELNGINDRMKDFEEEQQALRTQIEDAVAERLKAQNAKVHYEKKLAEEQAKVRESEEVAKVLQDEFSNWTEKAKEYCERVKNPRGVEEVTRNLESVQAALKEREKRHGATVEDMAIEVNRAKSLLDTAESDLKNMTKLNNALRGSVVNRLARWQEFRRHIALRCKLVFCYHLSNRGYYGKVLFDHNALTLQLKVQTDDQAGTQGRDKDPRSLSGGEKSFATICLLLSLWESIGCPIRCLDEFDVFMDAVNRRISMKMMIETAAASDKKQYILITPQDMGNVQLGKSVRVHRMPDPERGQGVLNMGRLTGA